VGVESDGWTKSESGVTLTSWNLSGVAYFYPAPSAGFFLKGGIGMGGWTASGSGQSDTESGFGFVGGVGYDLPVGRTISITPTATYRWSKLVDDFNQNVIQLGLSFTLH
jgi:opacity protein-like surface antigen